MRTTRALIATLTLTAGVVTAAGTADAAPSCLGQGVTQIPHGAVGPLVSGFAREFRPLGAIVSFEATSPKDACPEE